MSVFSDVLRKIIDDGGLWTRAEWAEIQGVRECDIEDWLSDRTIPPAYVLRGIISTAREDDRFSKEISGEWAEMVSRPAHEVSPHAQQFGRSVRHYMVKPCLEGFFRNFDSLPPHLQEEVLLEASALCRQKRSRAQESEPQPKSLRNLIDDVVNKLKP